MRSYYWSPIGDYAMGGTCNSQEAGKTHVAIHRWICGKRSMFNTLFKGLWDHNVLAKPSERLRDHHTNPNDQRWDRNGLCYGGRHSVIKYCRVIISICTIHHNRASHSFAPGPSRKVTNGTDFTRLVLWLSDPVQRALQDLEYLPLHSAL